MCYNYSYPGSEPGPIAPPAWIGRIVAYARKKIPAEKISLALKLQGFDWSGAAARSVTFEEAMAIAREYEARIEWDAESSTPHFVYYLNGKKHEVWFENAKSIEAKLKVIDPRHIGDISLWRLGGEDKEIYPVLARYLNRDAISIRSDTPD
jgi:spore germination protein YaaH